MWDKRRRESSIFATHFTEAIGLVNQVNNCDADADATIHNVLASSSDSQQSAMSGGHTGPLWQIAIFDVGMFTPSTASKMRSARRRHNGESPPNFKWVEPQQPANLMYGIRRSMTRRRTYRSVTPSWTATAERSRSA